MLSLILIEQLGGHAGVGVVWMRWAAAIGHVQRRANAKQMW